jgi:sortase A
MALLTSQSAPTDDSPPQNPAPDETGDPGREPRRDDSRRQLAPLDPLRILGQTLVWFGGLLLLFALFQLWGTGLLERQAQQGLDAEFDRLMAQARAAAESQSDDDRGTGTSAGGTPGTQRPDLADESTAAALDALELDVPESSVPPPTSAPPPPPEPELVRVSPDSDLLPAEGSPIARIDIPAIGVRKTIVQGVERETLRAGPGHYPTTPMPGQPGNAAIAGHRTTHGSPFLNLDRLEPGDHIDVETVDGVFRYEVEGHQTKNGSVRGHSIVHPSNVGVIADQGDDRLTLTACHPRYSARQRIIVTAVLIGQPSPEPVVVADAWTLPRADSDELADEYLDPTIAQGAPLEDTTSGSTAAPNGSPTDGSPDAEIGADASGTVDGPQTVGESSNSLEDSLGWQRDELDPTALWGVVTAVVIHAGWVLGRLWRRRLAYVLTAPVAVVPLFVCFVHLDRLLPAF